VLATDSEAAILTMSTFGGVLAALAQTACGLHRKHAASAAHYVCFSTCNAAVGGPMNTLSRLLVLALALAAIYWLWTRFGGPFVGP
jgi:hypothetical protein